MDFVTRLSVIILRIILRVRPLTLLNLCVCANYCALVLAWSNGWTVGDRGHITRYKLEITKILKLMPVIKIEALIQ